ncbi:MAG: amidohydrolase family protein [Planctomycetales bacterium]|nr:amidohydrolase family protein [Planctomycetales bacterium]
MRFAKQSTFMLMVVTSCANTECCNCASLRMFGRIRTLLALLLWITCTNYSYAQRTLAITGATVETVSDKGALDSATILIQDGKIAAIGPEIQIPISAQIIDARGKTILPGIVDPYFVVTIGRNTPAATTRTVVFNGRTFTIAGGAPSIATEFAKVGDGLDIGSVNWQPALRSGITTFHVVSGGYAQSLFARAAIVSQDETDVEVLEPNGRLLVTASNETKSLDVLRNNLKPADSRGGGRGAAQGPTMGSRGGSGRPGSGGPGTGGPIAGRGTGRSSGASGGPTGGSPTSTLWNDVRDGRAPIFINVNNASAILHTDAILNSYPKARIALVASGADVFSTLENLDKERYTVILPPTMDRKPNSAERINVPRLLSEKKIRFAFSLSLGQSDFQVHQPTPLLGLSMLIRAGLDRQQALRALTLEPAKLLGIDRQVGSLEVGKRADFVIFDDDPFSVNAGIEQVFIAGEASHE